MSTIETEGDGDGIEAPLDIPVPPGFNEDELEQIVTAASEMIERDMRRGAPAPAPEPAPVEAVDDTDGDDLEADPQEADEPPTPTSDVDGEGAEAASDPGKAVAAPSGSEAVGDDEPTEPAVDPTATADPGTEPAPEVDEWTRAGDAWERLYGQRPTFDQLQGIAVSATNYSNLLSQIQQLPQEHQQVLGDIIRGTFDPAAYAAQHAPAQPRDRDYDPLYDDPTAPTAPTAQSSQNDEVVRELRELRAAQERQQQDEYARTVQSDLARLQQDFLAANPHLAPEQFEQIALSVNRAGTWTNELQTRGAYDAYGRHLLAHAVAAGYDVNPPGAPATPTTAATPTATSTATTPTPAPAEHPVPADEHPLSAEEQAHAQRRQAAAAAVSGSSSPARATKRSVLDVDQPGHPSRPRTGHDLQAELVRAAEEMGLG